MRPIDRLNLLDLLNRGLRARLDFLSSRIPDPVNKLWFINRTLEGYEAKPESLRRLPIVRSIIFHYVALESIGELAGSTGQGEIFLPKSPLRMAYRLRHALLLITVLAVGYAVRRTRRLGTFSAYPGLTSILAVGVGSILGIATVRIPFL